MKTTAQSVAVVAKDAFAVIRFGIVVSDGWTKRAQAVRILASQERYCRAVHQSTDGFAVIQGGYDSDSGDKLMRTVYPTRTPWRLV
jgi:hypothetical protein